MVFVAQQHNSAALGKRLEQGQEQFEIDHAGFVDDDHVAINRIAPVAGKACMAAGFQQRVNGGGIVDAVGRRLR